MTQRAFALFLNALLGRIATTVIHAALRHPGLGRKHSERQRALTRKGVSVRLDVFKFEECPGSEVAFAAVGALDVRDAVHDEHVRSPAERASGGTLVSAFPAADITGDCLACRARPRRRRLSLCRRA